MNNRNTYINLNKEEYKRYARHIIMPNINIKGQLKLKQAKILFVGAGGLAASGLLYLVGAGVGNVGIIDDDLVELSNLHRQIIYNCKDVGQYKANSAMTKLQQLNPNCQIAIYIKKLNTTNAKQIICNYDIVIDSTDNFAVRHIISDTCYELHRIHIFGAVGSLEGQVSVFNYQGGPSYNDIHNVLNRENNNECLHRGIIGIIPGMIGLIQATEAIKIITGIGEILNENIMLYNSIDLSFKKVQLKNLNILGNRLKQPIKRNNIRKGKIVPLTTFQKLIHTKSYKLYLIDIRNPIEYKIKHLQGAVNIPLLQLKIDNNLQLLKAVSTHKYIIIYCSSKIRSFLASSILQQANIKHWVLDI